jgi:hypothetical protein
MGHAAGRSAWGDAGRQGGAEGERARPAAEAAVVPFGGAYGLLPTLIDYPAIPLRFRGIGMPAADPARLMGSNPSGLLEPPAVAPNDRTRRIIVAGGSA